MTSQDPNRLRELAQKLDEVQRRNAVGSKNPPPSGVNIAGRLVTELVAALVVGGGLGWGLDWLAGHFGFHTKPVFMILLFMLGAAAGLRNVVRTAGELNAKTAVKDVEK